MSSPTRLPQDMLQSVPWVIWNDDNTQPPDQGRCIIASQKQDLEWFKACLAKWPGSDSFIWNHALEKRGWNDSHHQMSEEETIEQVRLVTEFEKARELCQEGKFREAILVYGRLHQQCLRPYQAEMDDPCEVPFSKFIRKQLIKVYYEIHPDIVATLDKFDSAEAIFLLKVVEREVGTESVDELCILRDVLGYIFPHCSEKGQKVGIRLLRRLRSVCGDSHPHTVPLIGYLAKSYVYDGDVNQKPFWYKYRSLESNQEWEKKNSEGETDVTWEERRSLMQQYMESIEEWNELTLHYCFLVGLELLAHDMVQEAKAIFRQTIDRRQQVYTERHDKLNGFIDDFLETYCGAQLRLPLNREMRNRHNTDAFINDLIECCLELEKYNELEVFVQECRFNRIDTRRDTEDSILGNWSNPTFAQALLAKHNTPGELYFWEDNRMYLGIWEKVTLTHAFPMDPTPSAPATVIVSETNITPLISEACLEDYQKDGENSAKSRDDICSELQGTQLWKFLESSRETGDWSILLGINQACTPHFLDHCKYLSENSKAHLYWIFLDEHLKLSPAATDSLLTSSSEFQQDDTRVPRDTVTRFLKLSLPDEGEYTPESSWVAIAFYKEREGRVLYDEDDKKRCYNEEYQKPQTMQYAVEEIGENRIHTAVPFVPYRHFQKSRAYRNGFTYFGYIAVMTAMANRSHGILDWKKRLCVLRPPELKEVPVWYLPRRVGVERESAATANKVTGFCNGIPADDAILDHASDGGGLNFVSSAWTDWKSLPLHKIPPESSLTLAMPTGERVQCRGYICGAWTDKSLHRQWKNIRFYVVDCEFAEEGSTQPSYFLMNPASLGTENMEIVSSPDKRHICARLNPFLFRYALPTLMIPEPEWKRFRKKEDKKEVPETFDIDHRREEWNRREEWEKSFALRMGKTMEQVAGDPSLQHLLVSLEEERKGVYQARSY